MPDNKAERTVGAVNPAGSTSPAGCLFAVALISLTIGAWVQWGFGPFLLTLGIVALLGAALSKLR